MDFSKTYLAKSEEETEKIGEEFAKILKAGDLVALCGGLGMGKTAFTRGLARGAGYSDRVTSPTFAIVNEYYGTLPVFHFDLYRLSGADDLYDIGFEEYFSRGGVLVVEWFERAEDEFKPDYIVSISPVENDENSREITFKKV